MRKICRNIQRRGDSGIELMLPNKELEKKIMVFRNSFIAAKENSINGSRGLHHFEDYDEWIKMVKKCEKPGNDILGVQMTLYMAIRKADEKIVGCIELRHALNERLKILGGHVGYSVVPEERNKGYASAMLVHVIEIAKSLAMPALMLTCDEENLASARTIIKCGGVLEKEKSVLYHGEERIIKYYWITI